MFAEARVIHPPLLGLAQVDGLLSLYNSRRRQLASQTAVEFPLVYQLHLVMILGQLHA
jgi:hypothetical protein